MNSLSRRIALAVVALVLASAALDPVTAQAPAATAESESWYLAGGPVMFNGNVYYPAGPVTHFVRNEMVRSGTLGNTPVFVRATQEPGSIIYVPLQGGVVRPYERRRAGELAGTVGSTTPSFRVVLPAEESTDLLTGVVRGPAPPTGFPGVPPALDAGADSVPVPVGDAGAATEGVPVGTSGLVAAPSRTPVHTRLETARRPVGLNDVFVEFQSARWFAAGPAVEFTAGSFTKVGEHRGFAVYQQPQRTQFIYLSPVDLSPLGDAPALLVPYRQR